MLDHIPVAIFLAMQWYAWLIIAAVALLIFGAKLPKLARSLGSSMREFKKGVNSTDTPVDDDAADDPVTSPTRTVASDQSIRDLEAQIRANPNLTDEQRETMLAQIKK